jgi:hypothetical protein
MFEVIRPPKFRITKVTLNKMEKQIEIEFNRNTVNYLALKLKNFKFTYQSKKISLDRLISMTLTKENCL